MNTALKLQQKWGLRATEMARRLDVSAPTMRSWLAGGTPKAVGKKLLELALNDPTFDARRMDDRTRKQCTAAEWVDFLMRSFEDYCIAQFARRMGVPFATASAWKKSKRKWLSIPAETLLLYAYHNPDKFPTK